MALFGVDIPKPKSTIVPERYETIHIPLDKDRFLVGWHLQTDSLKKGAVILFHGYGDQTTMGYYEAENVIQTYEYLAPKLDGGKVFLSGFSMGAVAIMKAMHDKPLNVDGIILEAPFSTLEHTVGSRAKLLGIPKQPIGTLFTFWIGAVNGFNAFGFKSIEYVEDMNVPTLLMCGEKDQHILPAESKAIYDEIGGDNKEFFLFKESKHESYLLKHKTEWVVLVSEFLLCEN